MEGGQQLGPVKLLFSFVFAGLQRPQLLRSGLVVDDEVLPQFSPIGLW